MKTVVNDITNNERLRVYRTRERVRELTRLSEDEISVLTFDTAYDWLHHIGCDDFYTSQFTNTEQFWATWRQIWHEKDQEFLAHYDRWRYSSADAIHYYRFFHQPGSGPMSTERVYAAHDNLIKQLTVKR